MSDTAARSRARARLVGLVAIAALSLGLRITVFAVSASHGGPAWRMPDTGSYLEAADYLRGLPAFDGAPWRRAERTPLVPLWLALWLALGVGSPTDIAPLVALQAVLGSLIAPLVYWAASATTRLGWAAAIGALVALEPVSVAQSSVLMSETPYALALAAIAAAFPHALAGTTAGRIAFAVALGSASLVRPVGLLLPWVGASLLLLFAPARRWARGAALAVLLVALAPGLLWSARNYVLTQSFTLSTSSGWARALFARDVEAAAGAPAWPVTAPLPPWALEYGHDRALTLAEIESGRARYVRDVLRAHPAIAFSVWLRNAARLAGVPDGKLAAQLLRDPPLYAGGSVRERLRWLGELGPLGAWIALGMVLAIGGLLAIPWLALRMGRASREERALVAMLAALVLYHLALGALITGQGARYRAPVMPLLVWLAVLGLESLRGRPRSSG
jgi:hypothetical protein